MSANFIGFKFELKGQEEFLGGLNKFAAQLTNLRFLWPAISSYFYEMETQQFATEGGRATKWPKLRAGYAKQKAVRWPGKPILQAAGRLVASLTRKGAPGGIYEETDTHLRLGHFGIGAIHQRGGIGLAPRPPLEPTAADIQMFGKIFREGLQKRAEELGFRAATLS